MFFCSFSAPATGHPGGQIEGSNGWIFFVLFDSQCLLLLVCLSTYVTFLEIFKVNNSKFPCLWRVEPIRYATVQLNSSMDHTQTVWYRIAILLLNCSEINLSYNVYRRRYYSWPWIYVLRSKLNLATFRKFVHDYLGNIDRYDAS